MKPETLEWVTKAEGDIRTARREMAVEHEPNYDAVCYHAQQCVEKYLKAHLREAGLAAPRIHDLDALLNLALESAPELLTLRIGLQRLTDMAVEVRYPGMSADVEDATEALSTAESAPQALRRVLGL
jgi:HEPN domain-containing protein